MKKIKTDVLKFISVSAMVILLSTTYNLNAYGGYLQSLHEQATNVETTISQINETQESLHQAANFLRETQVDPQYVNSLGEVWMTLDETKAQHEENLQDLYQQIETVPPYTNYELQLLARIIDAESTNKANIRLKDMRYVGNVVINRKNHPAFSGNTIHEVVYASGQYSPTWDGNERWALGPRQDAIDVAQQLLEGKRWLPPGVVYQASFRQGSGLYEQVGMHLYCYY